ncbi:uncharacterized protein LOC129960687 [Argiope bruennichi]|uniref:uncharacterized protein LOC129960687 n=1 Tax=Argiope bruennichi TaxID=94029 RepID=UPI002494B717|nr:uncharacterized protein LOC129960687 [Argiope bruennichi]
MSKKTCRKRPLQQRLGWGVLESIDKEEKILKRNVWFGGKDKEILIKRLKLPNADIVAEAEEAKCVKANKDYFWTWELFATDIYRRPTATNAKSPYFFSYAFHHDGIAIATFNREGKEPKVERIKESFDNSSHHWDKKFHPFIQNQWVYSTYCESSVVALPPVTWASNQFRIVTDDAGIGILLTKGLLYIGVHFYSTGTGENYEDFGFRLFFRLRKMHADQSELLQKIIDTQMGRITPQTETHYGDPGTSIMDPDESTDFWNNSFLRTEHPLKQILSIEDSEQKNKRLRNNDEIQTANMTEEVIPPADSHGVNSKE